jgi:hypothetical protein
MYVLCLSFATQILFSSQYFHYKIFIHEKCLQNESDKFQKSLSQPRIIDALGRGPAVENPCSNFYIFRRMRRKKVLDWMVVSITQIQSPLTTFLLNQILICTAILKCQTVQHFSKGLLAIFSSWFCPAFWRWDSNKHLVFSAFTSRPTSLLVLIRVSLFYIMVSM